MGAGTHGARFFSVPSNPTPIARLSIDGRAAPENKTMDQAIRAARLALLLLALPADGLARRVLGFEPDLGRPRAIRRVSRFDTMPSSADDRHT